MATGKKRVAGADVTIGTDAVGCLTGWEFTTDVSEEEVSCLSDTVGDPPIVENKYLPTNVERTGMVEGVSLFDDTGQSDMGTAAGSRIEVTIELRYYDGSGYDYGGYFTSYSVSGSKDDFWETFTADVHINNKTEVTAPTT